ncbi:hypothetical protein BKP35_14395 [Anaerobacillus arseniciselenatis]|uniref:Prepilin-type N-terminal cleavage/methylation domain-containing protein n=1 Tax=Anaerobacillus arseniciselenatis TaxID=85682 RepID=A0A1S2LD79_9BACI|nr:type II secretion system protein [Anaerobacillus arseniciselenatis]OIJ10284.1 hypothetical protein BKP35_14395 [Anaerobacillus arseniciselenatis]
MLKTDKGMTLVELLLAMAIFSIVITVIWAVLFQGLNYSDRLKNTSFMQQEANLFITSLTRIHQTAPENYTIIIDNNPNGTKITIESPGMVSTFSNTKYFYSLYTSGGLELQEVDNEDDYIFSYLSDEKHYIEVFPNRIDLPIKIVITDRENINSQVEVETIISKIRG